MRRGILSGLVAVSAALLAQAAAAQVARIKLPDRGRQEPPPQVQAQVNPAAALNVEMNKAWERKDGCAKRIAIVVPDHPFVTGCGSSARTQVFYMDNGTFTPIGGTARSVGPDIQAGTVLGTAIEGKAHWETRGNEDGGLMRYSSNGQAWGSAEGICAVEAGTGKARGNVSFTSWTWVLGCSDSSLDKPILRRISNATNPGGAFVGDTSDLSFHPYPGAAVRLAVGLNDSVAWVVNSNGDIFRQLYCKGSDPDEKLMLSCTGTGEGWEQIPGCAKAISNGGNNMVWVIGCDTDAEGNGSVYQYAGADNGPISVGRWTKRAGRGVDIAVDRTGRAWVVTADGGVWRWSGPVPAKGQRIDSDPQGDRAADPR